MVATSGCSMRRSMGTALALAALLLPPGASAGGGAVQEAGLLQTPTYTLALVLLFFLVVSILFEKGSHALVGLFQRHKRKGLADATTALVTEVSGAGAERSDDGLYSRSKGRGESRSQQRTRVHDAAPHSSPEGQLLAGRHTWRQVLTPASPTPKPHS